MSSQILLRTCRKDGNYIRDVGSDVGGDVGGDVGALFELHYIGKIWLTFSGVEA